MSICTFIASDGPLQEVVPPRDYPLDIDLDAGTVYDGGADDNFYLHTFFDVQKYTNKKHGVILEWNYMDGRAGKIRDYIGAALQYGQSVELWHVWLMDDYEYEESPVIHKCTVPFSELTVDDLNEMERVEVWNTPDRYHPDRPSFYCLIIEP